MRRTTAPRGFTLVEMALVILIMGLLLVPLTRLLDQTASEQRSDNNNAALQSARDALLAYAVQHRGCLPHAADFEGGLPNTNAAGDATYTDTGSVRLAIEPAAGGAGQRAGDLPWADLGAKGQGLDANQHRIQYYVASAYTAPRQTRHDVNNPANDNPASRNDCGARVRNSIELWDNTAQYAQGDLIASGDGLYVSTAVAPAIGVAPPAAGWALFGSGNIAAWAPVTAYTTGQYASENGIVYRALADNTAAPPATSPNMWRAVGIPGLSTSIPAWQTHATQGYRRGEMVTQNGRTFRVVAATSSPAIGPVTGSNGPTWRDMSLPGLIAGVPKTLETRAGPVVDQDTNGQNATTAQHNVFVLIAAGSDNNAGMNRIVVRDANHRTCTAATTCANWNSLNDVNVDSRTFSENPNWLASPNSPDTLLAVSFAEYQAYLQRHGLIAQPLQY